MFTPLHHKKFSDEITEQIIGLIKKGELSPGDNLPSERQMCESLGVSRPPLREALKTLEVMGFVDIQQRRKIMVKSITTNPTLYDPLSKALENDQQMVFQLLEFRRILESWAVSRLTQTAGPKEIKQLEKLYGELRKDFETNQLGVDADVKFHLAICNAAGNTIVSHIAHTSFKLLRESQKLTRQVIYKDEKNRRSLLEKHRAILEAIKAKNSKKAKAALISHFNFAERQLKKWMASQE